MVNIIVVFPKLEDAKNIRNLLARNGYSVIGVCCTGAQVLQIIDNLEDGIVICGYRFNDMMYADLRESLASSFQMLLVASMHILESCDRRDIVSLPEYFGRLPHLLRSPCALPEQPSKKGGIFSILAFLFGINKAVNLSLDIHFAFFQCQPVHMKLLSAYHQHPLCRLEYDLI